MTVVFPESVKAQGNTSVVVVQTIASMAAPDLSSEIGAGSSVNVSCYLYGSIDPAITTNKGTAPRRLCTTSQFEQFGVTTYSFPDLQYVYDPQAGSSDPANAALAALDEGSEPYLVIRRGLNAQTDALTAGELVDVWHVRLGPQNRSVTGDDEFGEYAITQSVIVLEPPQYSVAIVA
jgi:hypothetical protein